MIFIFVSQTFANKSCEKYNKTSCFVSRSKISAGPCFFFFGTWPDGRFKIQPNYRATLNFLGLPYFIQETARNLSFAHFCCAQKIHLWKKSSENMFKSWIFFWWNLHQRFSCQKKCFFFGQDKDKFLDLLFPTLVGLGFLA